MPCTNLWCTEAGVNNRWALFEAAKFAVICYVPIEKEYIVQIIRLFLFYWQIYELLLRDSKSTIQCLKQHIYCLIVSVGQQSGHGLCE